MCLGGSCPPLTTPCRAPVPAAGPLAAAPEAGAASRQPGRPVGRRCDQELRRARVPALAGPPVPDRRFPTGAVAGYPDHPCPDPPHRWSADPLAWFVVGVLAAVHWSAR